MSEETGTEKDVTKITEEDMEKAGQQQAEIDPEAEARPATPTEERVTEEQEQAVAPEEPGLETEPQTEPENELGAGQEPKAPEEPESGISPEDIAEISDEDEDEEYGESLIESAQEWLQSKPKGTKAVLAGLTILVTCALWNLKKNAGEESESSE